MTRISLPGIGHFLVVASALLGALTAAPAQAAVRQIPGTRVTLDLPEDYQPFLTIGILESVAGFAHPRHDVRFFVPVELPTPTLARLIDGLSLQELRKRGRLDPKFGQLARSDPHLYLRFRETVTGRDDAVFMLVFADAEQTMELVASVPQAKLDAGAVRAADIEQALASARIVTQRLEMPVPARLEQPTIRELPARKELPGQRMYELDGVGPPDSKPSLRVLPLPVVPDAIAPSVARFDLTRRLTGGVAFPDRNYSQVKHWLGTRQNAETFIPLLRIQMRGIQVSERREVRIAGMTGVELVGHASRVPRSEQEYRLYGQLSPPPTPVGLYQVILVGRDLVYVMMASPPGAELREHLPHYRWMTESLTLSGR